jgi:hypothetical protein
MQIHRCMMYQQHDPIENDLEYYSEIRDYKTYDRDYNSDYDPDCDSVISSIQPLSLSGNG